MENQTQTTYETKPRKRKEAARNSSRIRILAYCGVILGAITLGNIYGGANSRSKEAESIYFRYGEAVRRGDVYAKRLYYTKAKNLLKAFKEDSEEAYTSIDKESKKKLEKIAAEVNQ